MTPPTAWSLWSLASLVFALAFALVFVGIKLIELEKPLTKPSATCKYLLIAGIALACGFGSAATLTVTVTNVASDAGQIRVAVYDEATWLDREQRIARQFLAPTSATVSATFEVPAGTYAVAVLHDVNENGRMDVRMMRPKEPFGFSNGVVPRFGPPKFQDSAFEIADEDVALTIELRD